MTPLEFYPKSFSVVVDRGGKGLDQTEVSLHCDRCVGDQPTNFGYFLSYLSLREALAQAEIHDSEHTLTIVDEGSCGFGLW